MAKTVPANIDEYISGFPAEIGEMMTSIRMAILSVAPQATEKISWGMPTFSGKKILVQFAGFKNHIGFFPGPETIIHFAERLKAFKTSKGGIHFPYSQPVPLDLIKEMVSYRKEAESSSRGK